MIRIDEYAKSATFMSGILVRIFEEFQCIDLKKPYLPESSIHGLNPQIFPFLQSIRPENWQISKLPDHLPLFEVSLEAYEHLSYLPKSKAEPQLRVDFGQPGPGISSEIDM